MAKVAPKPKKGGVAPLPAGGAGGLPAPKDSGIRRRVGNLKTKK